MTYLNFIHLLIKGNFSVEFTKTQNIRYPTNGKKDEQLLGFKFESLRTSTVKSTLLTMKEGWKNDNTYIELLYAHYIKQTYNWLIWHRLWDCDWVWTVLSLYSETSELILHFLRVLPHWHRATHRLVWDFWPHQRQPLDLEIKNKKICIFFLYISKSQLFFQFEF